MDSKQVSQLTTGAIIITVGLILLGGQMGVSLHMTRLWPLILIVIGVSRFFSTDSDGRRGNGAWLLFVGGLFLLNNFRILGLGDSWPLFIVAGGLSLMFGRHDRGPRRRRRGGVVTEPGPADRFTDGRFQS